MPQVSVAVNRQAAWWKMSVGNEHILAGDPPILVVLRRSARARRYSLRVSRLDGRVTLTLPQRASRSKGVEFVELKADWIRRRLANRPENLCVEIGAEVPLRGVSYGIVSASRSNINPDAREIAVSTRSKSVATIVTGILKAEARRDLEAAVGRFSAELGKSFTRLDLRDTRSRWGSCSAAGRLMFSWRLVMAPPEILSYVAAHEVAHLRHMNHGPHFWAAVERLWPDYREHRAWLRRNGDTLHRYRFTD